MHDPKELAALGLVPSDYETSSMQDIAAAAKAFERALNSAQGCVLVEMTTTTAESSESIRNYFRFKIKIVDQVYP